MAENILVVDDEREIADLVEVYLQNEGYTVYYKQIASANVLTGNMPTNFLSVAQAPHNPISNSCEYNWDRLP